MKNSNRHGRDQTESRVTEIKEAEKRKCGTWRSMTTSVCCGFLVDDGCDYYLDLGGLCIVQWVARWVARLKVNSKVLYPQKGTRQRTEAPHERVQKFEGHLSMWRVH